MSSIVVHLLAMLPTCLAVLLDPQKLVSPQSKGDLGYLHAQSKQNKTNWYREG